MLLLVSNELLEQVVNIGCGVAKDINDGLKYSRDVFDIATDLRCFSQKSKIFDLTSLLKECLVGGFLRSMRGEGREYLSQSRRILINQDFEVSDEDNRMVVAVL